jgi:HK97 gp10 family phage protein
MSVTITGVDELISKLNRISQGMQTMVTQQVNESAQQMVSDMKGEAPVRTGFLRDNISVSGSNEIAAQVSSLAYYSIYLEMGTWKMSPRPFFFGNAAKGFDNFATQVRQKMMALVQS